MLRPYFIVLDSFPQFTNRVAGPGPGTAEQGAGQQQEVN